jgi:hypothetical protein
MVHFFEELWRFKGLGLLWAVLIALVIVGMREAIKRIENRNVVAGLLLLGVGCVILISVLILNDGKTNTDKQTNNEQNPPVDSTSPINIDTATYNVAPDTTTLTPDFMKGHWKVISDEELAAINTTIKFDYIISYEKWGNVNVPYKKVTVETNEWRLQAQPISNLYPSPLVSSDNRIKLILKRIGSRMEGKLEVTYEEGFVDKKYSSKTYHLRFTKQSDY